MYVADISRWDSVHNRWIWDRIENRFYIPPYIYIHSFNRSCILELCICFICRWSWLIIQLQQLLFICLLSPSYRFVSKSEKKTWNTAQPVTIANLLGASSCARAHTITYESFCFYLQPSLGYWNLIFIRDLIEK